MEKDKGIEKTKQNTGIDNSPFQMGRQEKTINLQYPKT